MSTIGYSTLEVIPTMKNLRAQLEAQTSRDFAAVGKRGGQQLGDAAGKEAGSRLKGHLSSSLKGAFAPAVGIVAGAGLVQAFRGIISGASDAQQSIGATQSIFGKFSGDVVRTSRTASTAFGLSANQYREASDVFGALLKNQGVAIDQLGAKTKQFIGLGADLSATFGGTARDAVDALASAFKGEFDPLERYGISLNQTAVNAELAAKGQDKLTGAALKTAQQQATTAIILRQSADAQGQFAAQTSTLAERQQILKAQWSDMAAELGGKLLPATSAFTGFLSDDALPALEGVGGAAGDAAHAFGALPAPVKAAAGAFVALKVASATGLGTTLADGATSAANAMTSLRLKAMFAADAYRAVAASSTGAAAGNGRLAASFLAVRAGAAGAGSAMSSGLKGALGLVGGPWGAAVIGGTVLLTHFWQEHQKAKQEVEDFTATLDKETGALTESSRAYAANKLLKNGALAASQRLGLSLDTVTDAALGNKAALASITAVMAAKGQLDSKAAADAIKLSNAIGSQSNTVRESSANQKLLGAAMGASATAQGKSTIAAAVYVDKVKAARTAVQGLLDAENKRRNANAGILGDQIALNQAVADARTEAGKGKRTLDLTTQAGRDNAGALRDLADAWNGSAGKVKNAKGAYAEMRQNFIDVAIKMGDTRTQAQKLADRILNIPKRSVTEITTPGMKPALRDLREAHKELAAIHNFAGEKIVITTQAAKNKQRFATGGMIGGRGSGTSDSNLIFASRGEFMQRKAAVDYYGADFMAALNNLQVPRFASGGPIGPVTTTTSGSVVGHEIRGLLSWDRDGMLGLRAVIRDEIAANSSHVRQSHRLAQLGGIPPGY